MVRISIKIPYGYEEKFNKLSKEEKENLRTRLSSTIAEEMGVKK